MLTGSTTLQFLPNVVFVILDIIFFEITDALCKGKNIEIRGFGTYKIVTKKARIGRNPKNSKSVRIPAKKAVKWKSFVGI